MKQRWENEVELGVFASDIPPVGLCPGFVTVCEWLEQKWDWGQSGTGERFCQVLCLLIKEMRVSSPSTKQSVVLAQGVPCSPPAPREAGDKALALERLPGKKLYTEEGR